MKKILTLLTLAVTLWGCNKNEDPETPDTTLYQLVTYEGTNEETHVSVFTYQVIDDSPVITLTCAFEPVKPLDPGTRLIIGYTTETPGESGPIELKQASTVLGGKAETSAEPSVQTSRAISPVTIWRTGNYLNITARATLNSGATTASLLYRPEAPDKLYVVVAQPTPLDILAYERTIYCSWDISAILSNLSNSDIDFLSICYKTTSGSISQCLSIPDSEKIPNLLLGF